MKNQIKELYVKYKEIVMYIIAGGMTTVVSLALFYGSTLLFLDGNDAVQLQIANVLSWIGAVTFAYIVNRKIVFESKNEDWIKEAIAFVASRVLTLLLDMGVMFLLSSMIGIDYNVSKIASMVLVTIGNYVISKVLVFKKVD